MLYMIKTKISIPSMGNLMVDRSYLVDHLQKGRDKRLVLISGQAGSGKTSLACLWIDRYKLPVAWYSLDDSDNEPDLFFRYLMTSLQRQNPKLEPAFSPFLQGQKVFSPRDVVIMLSNALGNLGKDVYVVIDDYHVIRNREIHDAVQLLLQCAPPALHLVLLTRSVPQFSLTQFRLRNQITEIRSSMLDFTRKEARVFFDDVLQIDLPDEQLGKIYERTEGWAAGLQLAGLSLHKTEKLSWPETDHFSSDREIADYLIAEVFQVQPETVRNFLLKTAILERFNAELCHEMTGIPNADEILEQLERNNLFLKPLDPSRHWYRYHHLFAESLRQLSIKTESVSLPSLHRKAALWFAGHNYIEEAFHHALASKDIEFAADLMEDHLMLLLVNYETKSFRRWLNRLPPWLMRKRYLLKIYEGFEAVQQGYALKAEKILIDLEKRKSDGILMYSGGKRRYVEELLLYFQHVVSMNKDPVHQDTEKIGRDLQIISPENVVVRAELACWIAWIHLLKGDITKVLEQIRSPYGSWPSAETGFSMLHLQPLKSMANRVQGHLGQAETILQGLNRAPAQSLPLPFLRMHYHIGMGLICWYKNELDAALAHTESQLKYTSTHRLVDFRVDGYLNKAFILQAMGRSVEARRSMEKGQSYAIRSQSPFIIARAERDAAFLYLFMGTPDAAVRWEKKRDLHADEPFSSEFESDCLVLVHLWIVQKNDKQAVNLMESLRPRSEKRRRMESILKIDILYSAALCALKEREKAISILERAVEFASIEGYIRSFIDYAAFIVEMLKEIGQQHPDERIYSFVLGLIEACDIDKHLIPEKNGIMLSSQERLTPREVEVLKLLSSGYTYAEIAERAFVSLNTVKYHMKNIYGKLNTSSRSQAIMKAKELGIRPELR